MKEATGEVSMTVITLVAIAVIGGILAFMWPTIKQSINGLWSDVDGTKCRAGQRWDNASGKCVNI